MAKRLLFSVKNLTERKFDEPNIFVEIDSDSTILQLKQTIAVELGLDKTPAAQGGDNGENSSHGPLVDGWPSNLVLTFPFAEYNPLDDSRQISGGYHKIVRAGEEKYQALEHLRRPPDSSGAAGLLPAKSILQDPHNSGGAADFIITKAKDQFLSA